MIIKIFPNIGPLLTKDQISHSASCRQHLGKQRRLKESFSVSGETKVVVRDPGCPYRPGGQDL